MDTLTSMRVFRAVAAHESFSAAAKHLEISPAMATKHIAHLEAHLGARVFHRTTRRVTLTELGRQYLAQCLDGLDLIDAAEASVSQSRDRPSGILKITAPVWSANPKLAAIFAAYQQAYPEVILDIQLENRRVDLVDEGYDLALRATADPSPTLIVRPLGPVPFRLVATPDFFADSDVPTEPAQLSDYRAVLPTYVSLKNVMLESTAGRERVALKAGMYCNDTNLARHAVLAGMGIAFLPLWLVDDDITSGKLITVLPDYNFRPITLYAAYSSRRYMTSKVRTFIDFVDQSLKG